MGQPIRGLTPDRSRIRPKSRPARRRHPSARAVGAGAPPRLGKGHPSSAARRSDPPLTELAPLSPRGRGADDPHPGSRISLTKLKRPKAGLPRRRLQCRPTCPRSARRYGRSGGLVSLDGAAFANNLRRRLAVDPRCGGCGRDRRGRYRPSRFFSGGSAPLPVVRRSAGRSFATDSCFRLRRKRAHSAGLALPPASGGNANDGTSLRASTSLIRRSPLRLHELTNRSR